MSEEQDADPVVTFDWTTFDSPSAAVVTAVANEAGVDPAALEPLYEVVDPEALDALVTPTDFAQSAPSANIEFVYREYRVRVSANGQGYIYDRDDRSRASPESPRFEVA